MSKGQNDTTPAPEGSDWVQRQLAALRAALEEGQWPEEADRLLVELTTAPAAEAVEDEIEMLSLVISDALDGVDISTRYAHFYRRMLVDLALREAFLDALAILAPEEGDDLGGFPAAPRLDMPFLEQQPGKRLVEEVKEGWRTVWELSAAQLERIFGLALGPEPATAWRGQEMATSGALEEEILPILRDQVSIGEGQLEIYLEAKREGDAGEYLAATLIVAGAHVGQALSARLHWGRYEAQVALAGDSSTNLPRVPLAAIFAEDKLAPLRLEIVTTSVA